MNKKLISMAVGAALAAGTVMAQAAEGDMGPTVYGKGHASYGAVKIDDTDSGGTKTTLTDNMQFNSHASRIGVKGAVPISDSLKGTYGLEWGIDLSGESGFSNRNQYIGLKGGFGEVRFGNHDTPTKSAQGKFDEFNDTFGDFANIVMGDIRRKNAITYLSPDFTGFGFAAQLAPGEGNGCDSETILTDTKCQGSIADNGGDGPADNISIAAQYKMAGLFVSLGYDQYDKKANSADYKNLMRAIATYGNKMFQVGAVYEDGSKNAVGGTDRAGDKTSFGLSGHVTLADVHKIKLQYITGTEKGTAPAGDYEETQTSLGYDYKMGKSTTGYAMYTAYEGKDKTSGSSAKTEFSFVGIGLIQNF